MAADKDQLAQKVQQLMKKGQWDKALDEMKKLCYLDKSDPMAILRLGDLYLKAGDKKEAARCYYTSGELFDNIGHAAKAIAAYKMIQRIYPEFEDVDDRIERLAMSKSASFKVPVMSHAEIDNRQSEQGQPGAIELSEVSSSETIIIKGGDELHTGSEEIEPPPSSAAAEQDQLDEGVIGGSGLDIIPDITEDEAPDTAPQPAAKPIPLFSDIPREELWGLFGRMVRRTYEAGEPIVREGEEGDSLFIIRRGGARVVTHVKGIEVPLAVLGERDFFGEVSFLTGRPRTADIVASEPSEILELTGEELRRVIDRYPSIEGVLHMFHENRVVETLSTVKAVSKELFR